MIRPPAGHLAGLLGRLPGYTDKSSTKEEAMITQAIYTEREVTARYFNGAGYVVRREYSSRTQLEPAGRPGLWQEVTTESHAALVGIRQGTGQDSGLAIRRYRITP